jgi:hypothetical protein
MPTAEKAVKLVLPGEGRLEALFYSSITRVALPDLGADDNIIPASLISELEAAGMFVPKRTLAAPITVDLAVQGPGLSTLVTRQAKLTMELQLHAGPLRLRNVKWLVAENDMDEVLLGRPLLNALGIDAEAHLAAVRDTFQDLDCETIPSVVAGGRLSRILIHRDHTSQGYGGTEPPTDTSPDTSPNKSGSPATPVVYGDRDHDPIENGSLLEIPSMLSDENLSDSIEGMLTMESAKGLSPTMDPQCAHLSWNSQTSGGLVSTQIHPLAYRLCRSPYSRDLFQCGSSCANTPWNSVPSWQDS